MTTRLVRRLHRAAAIAAAALLLHGCSSDDDVAAAPAPTASARADNFTVAWNTASTLAVAANDTTSGGTATVAIASAPAHGTATIDSGAVRYTPAAGWYGADTLRYRVSVGSATSEADVALTVQATVRIQGQIVDRVIPNARVVATLGTRTVQATADATGAYTLDLVSSNPAEFVKLTATDPAVARVVLQSLVGDFSGLATVGASVGMAQLPALRVTHLTTATAGLIAQAGTAPATSAALAAAASALDVDTLLQTAALVKLVVDDGVALPTGFTTITDLLASASGLQGFVTAQQAANGPRFTELQAGLSQDPNVAQAPVAATLAAPVTLTYASRTGANNGNFVNGGARLTLNPDGSALLLQGIGNGTDYYSAAARWSLNGTTLTLTLDKTEDYTDGQGYGSRFFAYRFTDFSFTSGSITPASIEQVGESRTSTAAAWQPLSFKWSSVVRVPTDAPTPFTAAQLAGTTWGTFTSWRYQFEDNGNPGGYALDAVLPTARFDADGRINGGPGTWSVTADGALLLDPVGNGRYMLRLRRLQTSANGTEAWLLEMLQGGSVRDASVTGVFKTQSLTLGASDWAHRWQYPATTTYSLAANFGGQQVAVGTTTTTTTPLTWSVYGGTAIVGRVLATTTSYQQWQPLARIGNVLIVARGTVRVVNGVPQAPTVQQLWPLADLGATP